MLQGLRIGQLLTLGVDMGDALPHATNARRKLGFVDQTLGIAVDQAGHALT